MKVQNIAHDYIAILRLLPENDEDEAAIRETGDNLTRCPSCAISYFVTLEAHPRKALSIMFKPKPPQWRLP